MPRVRGHASGGSGQTPLESTCNMKQKHKHSKLAKNNIIMFKSFVDIPVVAQVDAIWVQHGNCRMIITLCNILTYY